MVQQLTKYLFIRPGTYDIESGYISAIPGGLELGCTFVSGSQAQSCLVTVCRAENGSSCIANITITRNGGSLSFAEQITNLPSGMYTIRQVAEVERDGEITVVRSIAVGEAVNVTDVINTSGTLSTPAGNHKKGIIIIPNHNYNLYSLYNAETPPTGGVSSPNTNAGAIAGG